MRGQGDLHHRQVPSSDKPDPQDFISNLLMLRPHNRLAADQSLEHSWLQVSLMDKLTVSQPCQEEVVSEELAKVLPTGKLKQWVTRRRWQRCSKVSTTF